MTHVNWLWDVATSVIVYGAVLVAFSFGLLVLAGAVMYVIDVTQKRHTIRRNYPVLGRFRYLFEHLGAFFRQYFFAMDREELPFNRALRSWVYRAAKNVDSTIPFGSTRPLNRPGDIIFLNALIPVMEEDAVPPAAISFGAGHARHPYTTHSIFNISAMSFGAISEPAVKALSRGARMANIWLNTGEGALSPHHLDGGCDIVFQVGTAKYGVRDAVGHLCDRKLREIAGHGQVKMFELKLSQGAKPGKGGILPGVKVTEEIAHIRGIPPGKDSISPNGHPEIRSVDDLLDLVSHIRTVTGKPTGFKCVIGQADWLDEMCQRILQRGPSCAPDFITIDSADGGTGAAPQSLMDFMGLPIQRSLPLVVDKLLQYDLRERIRVIASGKLVNPGNVAWALSMGADMVVSARGFMFALGCVQSLQCNRNTCPTGITTHRKELQRGLDPADKAVRVANYARNIEREVAVIAHSCGVDNSRRLNRNHAQIINQDGLPEPLSLVFPPVETPTERHRNFSR